MRSPFVLSALALLALACSGERRIAAPAATGSQPSVSCFAIRVRDVGGEVAFLRALDATVAKQHNGATHLLVGEQHLSLEPLEAPAEAAWLAGRANDVGFEHIAIVVRDMDEAYARLRTTRMVPVSTAPQTLPASNPVAGGVQAVYFRDPEGHFMELLHFPPGKGDPKWQTPSRKLFLGIDHSAVVVTSTERSLRFYQGRLGMKIASESLNEGAEQEALSGVAGARVRITSLKGEHGPGIELLEYLQPRDGRPLSPADASAWSIVLERTERSSPATLTDPDGHVLRFAEPR